MALLCLGAGGEEEVSEKEEEETLMAAHDANPGLEILFMQNRNFADFKPAFCNFKMQMSAPGRPPSIMLHYAHPFLKKCHLFISYFHVLNIFFGHFFNFYITVLLAV